MHALFPWLAPVGCPGRDRLEAFDRGRLAAPDIDAVAAHVSACEACTTVLRDLSTEIEADDVVAEVRRCMTTAPLTETPEYARMMAAARALLAAASTLPEGPDGGAALPRTRDACEGKTVGPYGLLRRLGQGGMGVVYLARQADAERPVALKMILAGHHAGVKALDRFARESRAIGRLDHPNVVRVYEAGEHEGQPYFAMELVEGGSLAARLRSGPLEVRQAAELVGTVARAVHHAHREGVIHRDLKPSNILLTAEGTPKITDFGLAKLVDGDPDSEVTLTESNVIMGSPSYMAPEQAEARWKDVGRVTDVYALGAILYELLTGRPPFEGESKPATLELVRKAAPVPPSRRRPEVPRALEAICLKCLEKPTWRRYASAEALAEDLGRWLQGQRPRGTPRVPQRLARGARRHVAAVLLGTAALTGAAATYVTRPERAVERIEAELARGRRVELIGAKGRPRAARVLTGKARTTLGRSEDGSLSVKTYSLALVELVPDSRTERYRLKAQVRQDGGNRMGEVGLYFAHSRSAGSERDLHFVQTLSFNDRSPVGNAFIGTSLAARIPGGNMFKNYSRLSTILFSDEDFPPDVQWRIGEWHGPPIQAVAEGPGRWHDLEVEVDPEVIRARWDGQPFSLERPFILDQAVSSLARRPKPAGDPIPRGWRPPRGTRGGLGLYAWKISASFRRVSITAL